jgi:hypothetical protein
MTIYVNMGFRHTKVRSNSNVHSDNESDTGNQGNAMMKTERELNQWNNMGNKIRRHDSTSHSQTSARTLRYIQDLQEHNWYVAIVSHEAWQKCAEESSSWGIFPWG